MGWSSANAYFEAFDVGLLSLNIPNHYFLVYGFRVLRDYAYIILPLYIIVVVGAWMLRSRFRSIENFALLVVPLLLLLLFVASYVLGDMSGRKEFQIQKSEDFPFYPRVKVWVDIEPDEGDLPSRSFLETANVLVQGCFRLLLEDDKKLTLFHTNVDFGNTYYAVTHVPIDGVRAWRTLPYRSSCE